MRNSKGQFIKGHKSIAGFKKGSKHSKKSKIKVSQSLIGKTGSSSRRWKGDNASYFAKHMWIKKYYGKPTHCESKNCTKKSKRMTWANLSGEYKKPGS